METSLRGFVAEWLLPHGVYRYLLARKARQTLRQSAGYRLAASNVSLHKIHEERRCFVLCNGPSVNKQDLVKLEGETVISVSSGYHHRDFASFAPRYHCVPQITYGSVTKDDVVRWFNEMHERLGDAELFLSSIEEPLVTANGLFPGRKIHYVFFHDRFEDMVDRNIPDLSGPVPRVQSVPVMCLMVAMYLGFKTIYLLVTEHDVHKTGTYKYFYGANILSGKDTTVDANSNIIEPRYDMLNGLAALWRQYRIVREIAEANGVEVRNATAGGELDEFPRVRFEELF